MDCQCDYVDLLESRYAGPSLQHGVVCANDGDRSWLYKEGLKYQKELHSQKVLPQLSPETTLK